MYSTFCKVRQVSTVSYFGGLRAIPSSISSKQRFNKRNIAVRSNDDEDGDITVDWDAAWSDFRSGVDQQVDDRGSQQQVRTKPPRLASGQQRNGWNSQIRDDIRKQERGLLDAWTGQTFYQLAAASAIFLLIFILTLAGPPPSDSRCTLPWC